MLLSTWEKDSFQGQIRTNAPSYDNQQTLDIVSGATNNRVVLMEQQIEKKNGFTRAVVFIFNKCAELCSASDAA